jgi:1-acyl-sn-glycerol-3-phosphate acyltransferase
MIRQVEFFGGWYHIYSGDVIPPNENVFVISNHKTWLDWLTLMSLAVRKNRLGAFKMFAKQSIALVPGIGWAMWLTNMVLIISIFISVFF